MSGGEDRLGKLHDEVARLENTEVSGIRADIAAASAAIASIESTDLGPVEAFHRSTSDSTPGRRRR